MTIAKKQYGLNFKEILYGVLLATGGGILGFNLGIFNNFYKIFITTVHNVNDPGEQKSIQGNLNLALFLGSLIASLISGFIYNKIGVY